MHVLQTGFRPALGDGARHARLTRIMPRQVGLLLGLFQLMRALSNWIIVRRGTSITVWLILAALCGFAFCAVRPQGKLSCWVYSLTGLGEIIVSLQHDMMLLPCMAENPGSLKRQFAWVCLGAALAFVPGSWLYTAVGFHASCLFGAAAAIIQLLFYCILYRYCLAAPTMYARARTPSLGARHATVHTLAEAGE